MKVIPYLPLLAALSAGCMATGAGSGKPYWEIEPRNHPPATTIPLNVKTTHPRLIFKGPEEPGNGRTFAEIRRLAPEDPVFRDLAAKALRIPLTNQHPAMLASCWIMSGDDRYAEHAVETMLHTVLKKSGEPYYSEIWSHALAYDWLYHHPALTQEKKRIIESKITERLLTELRALDENEMALWHGRNQAANGVMIAALAICDLPGMDAQLRRAAGHYIDCLRALQLSEGWPEGASYWIYNRAGPYAVAADCVLTALGSETIDGIPVREVMRKIGLWQVYQFAPDKVFEPYGDSEGSLRLGETGWWELTTDYYARLARDPALMAGADYIRNRSPVPYGARPYYWYAALSYDPSVRPATGYNPRSPETWMRLNMPQAMLFGRDSLGVAFFRSAWGDPDETYATFKAGDFLAHHDHYDAGHFAIQKGGRLAPLTGLYSVNYTGRHRLGYTIQTVSANSLLILAPGETSAYLFDKGSKVGWNALSGGQRVIRPTGFSCSNLEHFRDMLYNGPHLKRAAITAFESIPGVLDYIAADITESYNSTRFAEPGRAPKVSLVTRQFLFLRDCDAFIIYDRVKTTDKTYLPKLLLHTLSKPLGRTERLLAGNSPDDGILETFDTALESTDGRGRLTHCIVYPPGARALKIGGTNYNCYVQADGDQSRGFTGVNLGVGRQPDRRVAKPMGLWRTEVEPTGQTTDTRFLNVLLPALTNGAAQLPEVSAVEAGPSAHAVLAGNTVAVFSRDTGHLKNLTVANPRAATLILLDAKPGANYQTDSSAAKASPEGVLLLKNIPAGPCRIKIIGE